MTLSKTTSKRKKKPTKRLMYFFWGGKLHRTLRIQPGRNELFAWCYKDEREVQFVYSHIKFHHEPAYTTKQVCKFMDRTPKSVKLDIAAGAVRRPELSYSLTPNRIPLKYFWTREQIFEYHDYLLNVHFGRPRKDGKISPNPRLPSRNELRAMMEDNVVVLIQTEEGTFPAYRETIW